MKEMKESSFYGLSVTFVIAVLSFLTWWFLKSTVLNFSALLWSFVYSIILTNLFHGISSGKYEKGINFASSKLLRFSIAILGITISAAVWLKLGLIGIICTLIVIFFAFFFGLYFCRRILKMDLSLSILIGVGTCNCGATAIAATGPAIDAKSEEMGMAVATITIFGLIAMFIYPLLFQGPLYNWLNNNVLAYGMWAGMGVHETAQVIAAADQVEGSLSIAMMAKSIRIFMIGPMVLLSVIMFGLLKDKSAGSKKVKMAIPWFAVWFIILTFIDAFIESSNIGHKWSTLNNMYIKPIITFLLAWAFAGVGFKVKWKELAKVGFKSFLGGLVSALIVGIVALLLTKYVWLVYI
jgi:uncharacterized integral membrane protein (TIGR00698 family)